MLSNLFLFYTTLPPPSTLQTVAFVTCSDGSRHALRNGARGSLMEVNERLADSPHLLTSDPFGQGFLAIILPRKGERDAAKLNLVSELVYESAMKLSLKDAAASQE